SRAPCPAASRNGAGEPLLLVAARAGALESVELLLGSKAAVDERASGGTCQGWTALHAAAANGHKGVCQALLKQGQADVILKTPDGQLARQLAAAAGHKALAEVQACRGLGACEVRGVAVRPRDGAPSRWRALHDGDEGGDGRVSLCRVPRLAVGALVLPGWCPVRWCAVAGSHWVPCATSAGTTVGASAPLREFSEEVQRARAAAEVPGLLEARTYLDLQNFDIGRFAEKQRRDAPGSLQLMYMFYSRIYDKLVGKQKGVDVPLFAALSLTEPLLGFHAILDWARDFKVTPSRVGRRELERIFVTVHGGPQPPLERFSSKINYLQFLQLVALCGDAGEPMDRSVLDGSRVRAEHTRLEKVKAIVRFLCLSSAKKVKMALHNAYRDVHFWRLSDGCDFEREARVAEVRARPQWTVEPLPPGRQLDPDADAGALKHLQQFTWLPGKHTWEEFDGPILDMGTSELGGAAKRFRLVVTNRGLQLAHLELDVQDGGPLRLPLRDVKLSPGQSADLMVDFAPLMCGEWAGTIIARAGWLNGDASEVRVPTYIARTCASRRPRAATRPGAYPPARLGPSARAARAASASTPPAPRGSRCARPPSARGRAAPPPASPRRRPATPTGPRCRRGSARPARWRCRTAPARPRRPTPRRCMDCPRRAGRARPPWTACSSRRRPPPCAAPGLAPPAACGLRGGGEGGCRPLWACRTGSPSRSSREGCSWGTGCCRTLPSGSSGRAAGGPGDLPCRTSPARLSSSSSSASTCAPRAEARSPQPEPEGTASTPARLARRSSTSEASEPMPTPRVRIHTDGDSRRDSGRRSSGGSSAPPGERRRPSTARATLRLQAKKKKSSFAEFLDRRAQQQRLEDLQRLQEVVAEPEQAPIVIVKNTTKAQKMVVRDLEEVRRIFNTFDADQSGAIEPAEFLPLLSRLMRQPQSEMDKAVVWQCWEGMDEDGSGQITFDEFEKWYCDTFGCSPTDHT
ncbi:unnamed protein product, partial [Prorocentrum cordatum]